MARTREVFPGHMIPHLWAQQVLPSARSPKSTRLSGRSSISFEGTRIFSYQEMEALFVEHGGRRCVLINSHPTESHTTSKHLGWIRRVLYWDAKDLPRFGVPLSRHNLITVYRDHAAALLDYQSRVRDCLEKAKAARTHFAYHTGRAVAAAEEHNRFIRFFELSAPTISPDFLKSDQELLVKLCRMRLAGHNFELPTHLAA